MPYTTSTDYKGLTLLEITESVLWHLGQIVSGAVSYARYPRLRVLEAVNRAQQWVNKNVPSILKIGVINTKDDYGWYKAPPNMRPGGILRAYFFEAADTITELKLWDRGRLDAYYDGWRLAEAGIPEIMVPGIQMFGNRLTLEVYPRVDVGGTWATRPTGYYVGAGPTRTRSITGVAASGTDHSLTSPTGNFVNRGVRVGQVLWNVTDAGYGTLSKVTTTGLKFSVLTAGTFAAPAGDRYEVSPDYIGVVTDWNNDDDDDWIYGAELTTVSSLGANAGNMVVEYQAMPISLSDDEDYPQVPKHLQDALVFKTVALLASMGHEKVRLQELANRYEAMAQAEITPYIATQNLWPIAEQGVQLNVRFK